MKNYRNNLFINIEYFDVRQLNNNNNNNKNNNDFIVIRLKNTITD